MKRLGLALWLVSGAALPASSADALQLGAEEVISFIGIYLGDAELGCGEPDASGVIHCTGGPAGDPLLLPFRLDSWNIASGPGAELAATVQITDLGQTQPNVAGILLTDDSAAPIGPPVLLTVAASLEVIDANGDGTASIQPFPTSVCNCDASDRIVFGGYSSSPVFLPIALPVVSTRFGSAQTEGSVTVSSLDPDWFGLRILFGGDVSPNDTAVVHLSISVVPVPEPATALLAGGGLLLIAARRRPH